MTMKEYEEHLEKVMQEWHRMPTWVKRWSRELLQDMLKNVEVDNG